jgi:hypothetical protein
MILRSGLRLMMDDYDAHIIPIYTHAIGGGLVSNNEVVKICRMIPYPLMMMMNAITPIICIFLVKKTFMGGGNSYDPKY